MKAIAIIRLRGRVNVSYNVEHTLKLLHLNKPNHAVIYEDTPQLQGMLFKIKDIATWGEINEKNIEHLLVKRGELAGKDRVTNKHIKGNTEFTTIKQFSKAMVKGSAKMKDIPNIQPVFRLSPPRKGFKSLKYPVSLKGDLGYRGEAINDLIARMA
ncbi:MAG: 50S ribosomal protein L30 [Candidatus Heimdallarchaeota archaeon]|nr:50S ribosomal protein L30 [Candidatus Heimdallarchaeota archaeon]